MHIVGLFLATGGVFHCFFGHKIQGSIPHHWGTSLFDSSVAVPDSVFLGQNPLQARGKCKKVIRSLSSCEALKFYFAVSIMKQDGDL